MSTKHIPAWKRLGLKLKYTNDNAEAIDSEPISILKDSKRKQDSEANGSGHDRRQLKKPRFDVDAHSGKLSRVENQIEIRDSTTSESKKRVSFSTNTKIEDGDSAQTIQFAAPLSPGSSPGKLAETQRHQLVDEVEPARSSPKKEKRKEKKKLKLKGNHSNHSTPRKATAALEYLQQFQNDRPAWKFNKNHETWILKHTLSTESIDSKFNYSLAYYVSRLKSKGARQRLAEQSHAALTTQTAETPYSDAGDHEAKSRLLQALITDPNELNPTEYEWTRGVGRAVLILWSLNESSTQPKINDGASAKSTVRIKKNKSRTSRVDLDLSSSSEGESDSSSSDSESQHNGVKQKSTSHGLSLSEGKDTGDTSEELTSESLTSATTSDDTSTSSSDSE